MKAPLSLHARVAIAAALSGLTVLLATASVFQFWVSHVVSENLNARMDAQVVMLARAIDEDGRLNPARVHLLPDMEAPGTRWGWQVISPAGRWQGGAPIRQVALFPQFNQYVRGIFSAHARHPDGGTQHVRLWAQRKDGALRAVLVAAPDTELQGPETRAVRLIIGALAGLSALMALAAVWQLRFGLRPLRQLSNAIAQVRSGQAVALPENPPRELKPLVDEITSLVAQNRQGLMHTRHHVANLAHGLKTPLATLALRLEREGASAESRQLVAQLDKRIAHHLRRARSAAVSSASRVSADLGEIAQGLAFAMRHLHARRGIEIVVDIAEATLVAVDREDLDEVLGNLIDNACRHARAQVRVTAQALGQQTQVQVEDDGPGIRDEDVALALDAGSRLDESGEGYGFGLAIVQELAELYGGALMLDSSAALGGLRARLILPRARAGLEAAAD